MREPAFAKVNLCLLVGPVRADGRHELVSVMQSLDLCDELSLSDGVVDEVLCPGVVGPNLVAAALAEFRAASGWDGPPQRIEIRKRIPVAAGLGGGSADAAAALRLLARRSGVGDFAMLHAVAARLGSDVPSQLRPGRCLVRGGGEVVERLDEGETLDDVPGVLVLPAAVGLSAGAVYAEADRLGLPRGAEELRALDPFALTGVNDLEAAALSLEPSIARSLALAREAGATHAFVSGSGPTVIGLFAEAALAEQAAARLADAGTRALAAKPMTPPH